MNDRFFFNIILVPFSYFLYLSGILFLLMKLLVKKGLYVFNYHSFNTFENDYWKFGSLFSSNYQDNFAKQINFFDKYMKGVDSFDFGTVHLDKPKYVLTFDDGFFSLRPDLSGRTIYSGMIRSDFIMRTKKEAKD